MDSLFSFQRFNSIYRNIIEEKSNALLMDEETTNFYHFNLNVCPSGINYAVYYVRSILNILARYNGDICKELIKQLKN